MTFCLRCCYLLYLLQLYTTAEGMDFDVNEFVDRKGLSVQDVEQLHKVELRAVADYRGVSLTSV